MNALRRVVRLRLGVGCTVCLLAVPVWAAEAAPLSTAPTPFLSLFQVMLGLALVLAAIAGTAWLLKRLTPGQVAASGVMRVVGGVAVGPKERVVLVDVADTRLVLGVAPGRVTMLCQMPRPEEEAVSVEPGVPFASQLTRRLRETLQRKEP